MGMKTIGLPGKDLVFHFSLGLSAIEHWLFAAGAVNSEIKEQL